MRWFLPPRATTSPNSCESNTRKTLSPASRPDRPPPEIAAQLPPLYANEEKGEDAIAHLKLFTPWTSWTWYASEYDPAERLCFGVVVGHERELGYFSLAELEEIRGPGGLRIERDLHWKPRPIKECR